MNTELLLKVKSAILNDAESFDMWEGAIKLETTPPPPSHECFTIACIAGWAVFLTKGDLKEVSTDSQATYPWSYFYQIGRERCYISIERLLGNYSTNRNGPKISKTDIKIALRHQRISSTTPR